MSYTERIIKIQGYSYDDLLAYLKKYKIDALKGLSSIEMLEIGNGENENQEKILIFSGDDKIFSKDSLFGLASGVVPTEQEYEMITSISFGEAEELADFFVGKKSKNIKRENIDFKSKSFGHQSLVIDAMAENTSFLYSDIKRIESIFIMENKTADVVKIYNDLITNNFTPYINICKNIIDRSKVDDEHYLNTVFMYETLRFYEIKDKDEKNEYIKNFLYSFIKENNLENMILNFNGDLKQTLNDDFSKKDYTNLSKYKLLSTEITALLGRISYEWEEKPYFNCLMPTFEEELLNNLPTEINKENYFLNLKNLLISSFYNYDCYNHSYSSLSKTEGQMILEQMNDAVFLGKKEKLASYITALKECFIIQKDYESKIENILSNKEMLKKFDFLIDLSEKCSNAISFLPTNDNDIASFRNKIFQTSVAFLPVKKWSMKEDIYNLVAMGNKEFGESFLDLDPIPEPLKNIKVDSLKIRKDLEQYIEADALESVLTSFIEKKGDDLLTKLEFNKQATEEIKENIIKDVVILKSNWDDERSIGSYTKRELEDLTPGKFEEKLAKEIENINFSVPEERNNFFTALAKNKGFSLRNKEFLLAQSKVFNTLPIFKTMKDWNKDGAAIKKGEKAYFINSLRNQVIYIETNPEGEKKIMPYTFSSKEIMERDEQVKRGELQKKEVKEFYISPSVFNISQIDINEKERDSKIYNYFHSSNTKEKQQASLEKLNIYSEALKLNVKTTGTAEEKIESIIKEIGKSLLRTEQTEENNISKKLQEEIFTRLIVPELNMDPENIIKKSNLKEKENGSIFRANLKIAYKAADLLIRKMNGSASIEKDIEELKAFVPDKWYYDKANGKAYVLGNNNDPQLNEFCEIEKEQETKKELSAGKNNEKIKNKVQNKKNIMVQSR